MMSLDPSPGSTPFMPMTPAVRVSVPALQRGFSLIELMVSLVIGLVVTLAITGVMVRSEGAKRTNTSVNDVNQTGAYAAYVMDRSIRSAGSGFAQLWNTGFGCRLNLAKSSTVLLPSPAALPAPFTGVTTSMRLAPVVIGRSLSDGGSDTLTVMAGNAGYGESSLRILPGGVTAGSIGLPNTLTFSGGDLVMLVESGIGTPPACLIEQVAAGFVGTPTLPNTLPANQLLPVGGVYASTTGTDANMTQYGLSGRGYIVAMGNAANPSQFQLFGVGANNTLFSYDILQLDGTTTSVPIADGVVEMRALYGIDTNLDGVLDSWVQPGTDGSGDAYSSAVLTSGSAAATTTLRSIVSIRVGFTLRTSLYEKDVVPQPATITMFSDLGAALTQTRTLTSDETHYRFRTVEITVPLRNMLML